MTGRRGFARRFTALTAAAAWLTAGNAAAFLDTGTLLTNAASATYMGGGQGTSVTYSATAKILVANPAVYLYKDVSTAFGIQSPQNWSVIPFTGGGNATYTICFSNGGANTAFNVTIFDRLPLGTAWVAAGYSGFYVDLTGTGRAFTAAAVAPDGSVSYSTAAPPPWTQGTPANGTVAPIFLQWVVPALGIGKSGCVTFVVSIT